MGGQTRTHTSPPTLPFDSSTLYAILCPGGRRPLGVPVSPPFPPLRPRPWPRPRPRPRPFSCLVEAVGPLVLRGPSLGDLPMRESTPLSSDSSADEDDSSVTVTESSSRSGTKSLSSSSDIDLRFLLAEPVPVSASTGSRINSTHT